MKALKIIIPILLLALIGVGVYFYFTSDFQFTSEFYISAAERAYKRENLTSAAEYYEKALAKEPDNPGLVLTLAGVYTELGNYTKTEYTLVRGISYMPSQAQLYIQLSRAYVAQNKLLDAVSMLSGIADQSAAAAVAAARPAAPTVSPDGGEYSEYLNVSLSYPAGCNAYYSIDGSYPNTETGFYSETIPLTESASVIAISVSAEGLVSVPVVVQFEITHVITDVSFTDPEIERIVRISLDVDENTQLTTEDLWQINTLIIPETAYTLEDLHWFLELPGISFSTLEGFDLTELLQLKNLKELTVSGCSLTSSDLEIIGTITGLTYLDISNNTVSSLAPLSSLTGLRTLIASNNSIVDLSPLSGLTGLEIIDVSYNAIESISALKSMTSMRSVNIAANLITSIDALSDMSMLYYVNISSNKISSIKALENKTALEDFDCSNNSIASITPLKSSTALITLNASSNVLTDIDVTDKMTALRTLNASNNKISSVPSYENHKALVFIYLSNNQLTSVDSFVYCPALNMLELKYNKIEDISQLIYCQMLVQVDVFGNNVGDTRELTEAGIIVIKGSVEEPEPELITDNG